MSKKNKTIKNKPSKPKKYSRVRENMKLVFEEIRTNKFSYSFKKYISVVLIVLAAAVGSGLIFKLQPAFIGILSVIALCCVPFIITAQFMYVKDIQKFNDMILYMEQMIYSFRKKPKILSALYDTQSLANGKLKEVIGKAIEMIENSNEGADLYKNALNIIKSEYNCSRMESLHNFIINIETKGGDFENSLNNLLNDIQLWAQRVAAFQKDVQYMKRNILISLIMSLSVCAFILLMIPNNYSVAPLTSYQVTTTIVIALYMIIYAIVQTNISGSSVIYDVRDDNSKIMNDYNFIINYDEKKRAKDSIILACISFIIPIAGMAIGNVTIIIIGLVICIFMTQQYKMVYRSKLKRVTREIEKEFPDWLRDVALSLQSDTVYNAINSTLINNTSILRPEIEKLVTELNEDPVSMQPYTNFCNSFYVPEISSAMKMIYSIGSSGSESVEKQINTIIERNQNMIYKAEKLKSDDALALISMIKDAPIIIAIIKMLFDMSLILTSFLNVVNGVL